MPRLPKARQPLLDAALRLFVEHGIDGTSVRDLARAAGCSEAGVYSHWASKDALVETLYVQHLTEVNTRLDQAIGRDDPLERQVSAAVASLLALFDEQPMVFRFVLLAQHDLAMAHRLKVRTPLDSVQDLVSRVRPELVGPDAAVLAAALAGLVLENAMFVLYGRLQPPLADHAPRITAVALRLLRP